MDGPKPPKQNGSPDGTDKSQKTTSSRSDPQDMQQTVSEQEDHDLALALQLHEEEVQQRQLDARRRREQELSEQSLSSENGGQRPSLLSNNESLEAQTSSDATMHTPESTNKACSISDMDNRKLAEQTNSQGSDGKDQSAPGPQRRSPEWPSIPSSVERSREQRTHATTQTPGSSGKFQNSKRKFFYSSRPEQPNFSDPGPVPGGSTSPQVRSSERNDPHGNSSVFDTDESPADVEQPAIPAQDQSQEEPTSANDQGSGHDDQQSDFSAYEREPSPTEAEHDEHDEHDEVDIDYRENKDKAEEKRERSGGHAHSMKEQPNP